MLSFPAASWRGGEEAVWNFICGLDFTSYLVFIPLAGVCTEELGTGFSSAIASVGFNEKFGGLLCGTYDTAAASSADGIKKRSSNRRTDFVCDRRIADGRKKWR